MPLLAAVGDVVTETLAEFAPVQPDRSPARLERRYTNAASAFLDARDARVHYRDEGPRDAPTFVTIHGTYSSLHTWDGWVEHLTDEFRVVRPDMPGFGLTGPREGRHTVAGLVESVAALCDELELASVAVAGNSLGGGVAWRLAVERPDLVSRLVLVDSGGATLLSHIAQHYEQFGNGLLTRYAAPRVAVRMILRDAYGDPANVTEALVARYYDMLLRSGNRRAVMDLAGNYRDDHFPEAQPIPDTEGPVLPSTCDPRPRVLDGYDIADVEVPTLFQWGAEDTWLPPSFGRELAARVPDHEFLTYDGVGHVPMEEAPGRTAADAAAFLRRTQAIPSRAR
jgi:pimeloyl-ACP methyl ester carboxylesterase